MLYLIGEEGHKGPSESVNLEDQPTQQEYGFQDIPASFPAEGAPSSLPVHMRGV